MTKLSVNINKIATIRNARGGNNPDILQAARDIEHFGAEGITVHPRPDERHIRYQDVRDLKKIVQTELNVEGYPNDSFMKLVLEVCPNQVTLVPDPPDVLTSNNGWDCIAHQDLLAGVVAKLKDRGIRTSIFLNPDVHQIEAAQKTGVDRIELYTEGYAKTYSTSPARAIKPYVETAEKAAEYGLGLNAGHDLDLHNLHYFVDHIPGLLEVSIGHALICDALYLGLEETVKEYLKRCSK
jgi:pyridoxine 5-phosphate synthase